MSMERQFDYYMKSLAESIGCDMELFNLPSAHGNDRLRWAVLIQGRLGELGVLKPRMPVAPRPSTGHPAEEFRCNICGGLVHFDGTPPVPGNWGGRT